MAGHLHASLSYQQRVLHSGCHHRNSGHCLDGCVWIRPDSVSGTELPIRADAVNDDAARDRDIGPTVCTFSDPELAGYADAVDSALSGLVEERSTYS